MEYLDKYYITGRGLVLSFKYEDGDKDFKIGEKIMHEGKPHLITGVEGSWLLVSPPRRSPHVGIVVREITKEEYHG